MAYPAVILVQPQLGENIGKAARAMLNFNQREMRLVAPRDGWPNPAATPAASGADEILEQAAVFASTQEAVADCQLVFASTVRPRGMTKPVVTPRVAAQLMHEAHARGEKTAVLFGPERSGLNNDDVALADMVVTVPVNPEFGSLNLAQAVILLAYEYSQFDETIVADDVADPRGAKADKAMLEGLLGHMEQELEPRGFFRSEDRRDTQRRMLWALLQNAQMSEQEVQTWRGIVKALARTPRGAGEP